MPKAILIDAEARDIREVEAAGLADLQKLVGGYIETAWSWPSGDVLFVDEEGLFKPQRAFFRLTMRSDQPLAGNGVVIGRERYDTDGDYLGTDDTTLTVEELQAAVVFLSRTQADAWAKGNASEPAATFSYVENGRIVTEVLGRMGSVYREMPKPEEEEPS